MMGAWKPLPDGKYTNDSLIDGKIVMTIAGGGETVNIEGPIGTPDNYVESISFSPFSVRLCGLANAPDTKIDAPDKPGHWAWEGYINYTKGCEPSKLERRVVRVYWGQVTQGWHVIDEHGRRPASMMIGEWTRLYLPWDEQP